MKMFLAIVSLAALLAPTAKSEGLSVRILHTPEGPLYAEKPDISPARWEFGSWTVIPETPDECISASTAYYRGVEGDHVTVSTPDRMEHYLVNDGTHYVREQTEPTWTQLATGTWQTSTAAWVGEDAWFLNDPRPGYESYWYMQNDSLGCHVFQEESRSEDSGVLTVVLSSGIPGLPAWTLSAGRAWIDAPGHTVEAVGNWLE